MSIQLIKTKLKDAFLDTPITFAGVFGSYAKGTNTSSSDVDILFQYDADLGFSYFDLFELKEKLEKTLGKNIDLVPMSGLKSAMKDEILATTIKIYEKR